MKKLLLASLITAASFGANASSVITFDDSSFGGTASPVVFDFLDFDADLATVTQTDDGNGNITGNDAFSELGSTDLVNFKLGADLLGVDAAYEVFFNYNFSGVATVTPEQTLEVSFNDAGTTGLYIDTTVNGVADMGTATQIVSFGLNEGSCSINVDPADFLFNKGFCGLDLSVNFLGGLFTNSNGEDLTVTPGAKSAELIVTVQDIFGLDFFYTEGDTQTFQIQHDGNLTFDVPEPTSIAILGLGLLGFAGARRRKA